jgi:ADP-ribose pyrophosphatase YjhB (NUDIX family)
MPNFHNYRPVANFLLHAKEVRQGDARVIFIEGEREPTWALPGGVTTTDRDTAQTVAANMARLMRENTENRGATR